MSLIPAFLLNRQTPELDRHRPALAALIFRESHFIETTDYNGQIDWIRPSRNHLSARDVDFAPLGPVAPPPPSSAR